MGGAIGMTACRSSNEIKDFCCLDLEKLNEAFSFSRFKL